MSRPRGSRPLAAPRGGPDPARAPRPPLPARDPPRPLARCRCRCPGPGEAMGAGRGVPLALLALLALQGAGGLRVGNTIHQAEFYQRDERQRESAEFLQMFDADEMLHVDPEKKETVWRLPEFGTFAGFQTQGALQNLAISKYNLEIDIKRTNSSRGTIVPPEVTVFPKRRVELEDPNVLICYVEKFWPSVLSISWLKNGQEVTMGVFETIFYPREDNTFRKFSYLPFVPTRGDVYDCRVEHEGLPRALLKHWEPQLSLPASETTETLVCALGLAVGIVGIVVGTVLIIKAMKTSSARSQRDPL